MSAPHGRRVPRNIELRRAVLRILLRAHRKASASQRISNLLGWQVRQGRVRRVGWGAYVTVPEAIPRTTQWRIEHWDELD